MKKTLARKKLNFLKDDFYVDDGLKSVKTVNNTTSLIKSSSEMCKRGGIRLHKLISNRKEAIESIPTENSAKGIKDLDLDCDVLPTERALGGRFLSVPNNTER